MTAKYLILDRDDTLGDFTYYQSGKEQTTTAAITLYQI